HTAATAGTPAEIHRRSGWRVSIATQTAPAVATAASTVASGGSLYAADITTTALASPATDPTSASMCKRRRAIVASRRSPPAIGANHRAKDAAPMPLH